MIRERFNKPLRPSGPVGPRQGPLNPLACSSDSGNVSSVLLTAVVAAAVLVLVVALRKDETVRMLVTDGQGRSGSVEAALAAGRKIEAIKLYRERHGVGLREAKEAVEALQRSVPVS